MSSRPPSRVPWILFQGLVLGLPAAGLILLTTWVLRYAGLVIPWSPALGLSIGVMTGSLSLAAFQTFDHAPPRGLDAETEPASTDDEAVESDPEAVDPPPPSMLARVTAGILVGSIMGLPTALVIFAIGLLAGLVMGDVWRFAQPAGIMAAMAYYAALAAGIRRSLN